MLEYLRNGTAAALPGQRHAAETLAITLDPLCAQGDALLVEYMRNVGAVLLQHSLAIRTPLLMQTRTLGGGKRRATRCWCSTCAT